MLTVSDNHIVLGGGGGGGGGGSGDVVGAVSSTDNAIARFDGTTGKVLQNSVVIITDNNTVGIGTSTPMDGTGVSTNGSLDVTGYLAMANGRGIISRNAAGNSATTIARVSSANNTEIYAFGGSNIVFMMNAKFNAALIDNSGSAGTDGQVLKKVGGQVLWTNP